MFLERQDDPAAGVLGARTQVAAGVDAAARIGDVTELRVVARAQQARGLAPAAASAGVALAQQLARPYTVVDASLVRNLAGSRAVSLRWRDVAAGWGRERLVQLAYRMPLGVPVGRAQASGRVVGRLYDAETGAPVARALVRVGDRTVVTDAAGRLVAGGLPPRAYFVQLDPETLGGERVAARSDVLRVDVRGGRTAALDLGVVRAGRVAARVVRLAPAGAELAAPGAADTALVEQGGVRDLVVELRHGAEVVRGVTDADGRAEFGELRPGRWTLVVVGGELPERHRLLDSAAAVDVAPGGLAEPVLRVAARRRVLRMLGGDAPAVPGLPGPRAPRTPGAPAAAAAAAAGEALRPRSPRTAPSDWPRRSGRRGSSCRPAPAPRRCPAAVGA
jgi:hypothetical protein